MLTGQTWPAEKSPQKVETFDGKIIEVNGGLTLHGDEGPKASYGK
jgi:hypothetical protein